MRKIGLITVLTIVLAMILYFILNKSTNDDLTILDRYNLQNMDIYELVSYFEETLNEDEALNVFITGKALTINDHKDTIEIDLPQEQFFLSLAPYINQTHPCSNHNLITCRGELTNQNFELKIIDLNTNVIIIDQTVTSEKNGFIGVWLPKNIDVQITVTQNNLSSTTQITTNNTSNTCLTTLKLS